jgi:hypothetical protein
MIVTPGVSAFKKPVLGFIVATDGLLLLHVPSRGVQVSTVFCVAHNEVTPIIGVVFGFTAITIDVEHGPSV